MDKYYTPELNEFHIGFEYEYEDINESGSTTSWYKTIVKENECYIIDQHLKYSDDLNLRVKYLDKEDIESLGWKLKNDLYIKDDLTLQVHKNSITIKYYDNFNNEWRTKVEQINIKNKSEFIKLLKQLQIG
jgi:ribosomal protein S13